MYTDQQGKTSNSAEWKSSVNFTPFVAIKTAIRLLQAGYILNDTINWYRVDCIKKRKYLEKKMQ